jgi:YhcH/YjgK/YiaL family protein
MNLPKAKVGYWQQAASMIESSGVVTQIDCLTDWPIPFSMIHDILPNWRRIPGFASHPIWRTAFEWLETNASTAAEGYHQLGSEGFFARVMSYATKGRNEARYEMHRNTIDIQYTVMGAEGIELSLPAELTALNDYAEAGDVEHFATPERGSVMLDNRPGRFSVLFAGEPHLPQLILPGATNVRKVVIKVPVRLVG